MTIEIAGPPGSLSNTILLGDIVRVEARTLSYLGTNAYNLYLVVQKSEGERFFLYSYASPQNMAQAYERLNSLLKKKQSANDIIEIVPPELELLA